MSSSDNETAPAGFTLLNLDDVKDLAPNFGYEEIGEARFANDQLGTGQTGLSFHRVKPGKRQAFGHVHEEAEEVYVVIGGSGRIALDNEIVTVGPLDALRVGPEVKRAIEAGPEGIELLAFGARHEGDGEILPGWWPDEAEAG